MAVIKYCVVAKKGTNGMCALCRQQGELRDSHLIPKATYRWIRLINKDSPILITPTKALYSDRQVSAPVLCQGCEHLFNVKGERWTLENSYRGKTKFRLREALLSSEPLVVSAPDGKMYNADTVTGGNADKLVYFAASIFWRATARTWAVEGHQLRGIDLGRTYTEDLRLFLLGKGPFPDSAVLVAHAFEECAFEPSVTFPHGGRAHGMSIHGYHFAIPGLLFGLYLGKQMSVDLRKHCLHHALYRPIWLSRSMEREVMNTTVRAFGGMQPVGRLKTG